MGRRTNTAVWLENYKRWQVKVMKDSVRKTFTCSAPGRAGQRECNAKADAWLDGDIANNEKRVSALYAEFVESLKLSTSTANWKNAESFGRVWILPAAGHKKISRITEQNFQDIINAAASAGKRNKTKGMAKKSLANLRATIKAFLKFCRKSKATSLLPENLIIPKNAPRSQKAVLQPEYLVTLFSSDQTLFRGKAIQDKFIHAYRFQVITGLRPGELLGLWHSDINGITVNISRSVNNFGEETEGKNENAARSFILTQSALNELDAQTCGLAGIGPVFDIPSQKTYRNCWYRYCKFNGIPKITPYELRHTFVSIAKKLRTDRSGRLSGTLKTWIPLAHTGTSWTVR
jgi:integrase